MPTTLGSLRRLLLTPALAETTFARRGFPTVSGAAARAVADRLEAIPQAVICGFEWGIDTRDLWELERRLALVEPVNRGFAYEGAAMALTVVDAMAPGRGRRAYDLLAGPGVPHTFLTYIGVGFAMARLPRPLWRKILPDLTGTPYYPQMSWLAVDGYGFDRAYFETSKWVDEQKRLAAYPWRGRADYFPRAVDQGIGRALWFIHNGRTDAVAAAVQRFAESRQADLYGGVGLAAAFAGGADAPALHALVRAAGEHWPHLAQGAVFAAKARTFAGFVPEPTEVAVAALAGLAVDKAAALADDVVAGGLPADAEPDYEVWRRAIREQLAVAGTPVR
jgi:hypothetical protein